METVAEEVRLNHDVKGLTSYEKYRYANVLEFLSSLRGDEQLSSQALNLYRELLHLKDQWSPIGRSNLWELIGEAHKHRNEWAEARNAYLHALESHSSELCKIFLAECYVQLDQANEAKETIAGIPVSELSRNQKTDYAFAKAAIAIEIGDIKYLEETKAFLKDLHIPEPYFRERRDALVVAIQEVLLSGRSQTLTKRARLLLAEKMRSFFSYVTLKPSFMGIGLDVGKFIEDLSGRKD